MRKEGRPHLTALFVFGPWIRNSRASEPLKPRDKKMTQVERRHLCRVTEMGHVDFRFLIHVV